MRRYAEHRDLAFFMYEKHLASTYFAAHCRAKDFGVTADVMARTSQLTAGYWEIAQDALVDVVRLMMQRCNDAEGYPELFKYVHGLHGQPYLCGVPNLFITIAPAEWRFPKPYFPEPYAKVIFAGAYLMALHMF